MKIKLTKTQTKEKEMKKRKQGKEKANPYAQRKTHYYGHLQPNRVKSLRIVDAGRGLWSREFCVHFCEKFVDNV